MSDGINEAFAAWSQAYQGLLKAESRWAEAVLREGAAERSAARQRMETLRRQCDELLDQAARFVA